MGEMLLDLAGNKFDPSSVSIDDWQSEATAFYDAVKAGGRAAGHVYGVVDRIFTAWRSDRDRFYARNPLRVAPGDGMEPIKGAMGNSTVSDPSKPMAYGRRAVRTRYARPASRQRKSGGLSKGMASAVRKIAKKAIVTVSEKKYVNYIQAAVNPTATPGLVISICDTAQGDGDAGFREGDQIRLFDTEIRGKILAATAIDVIRVIVFYWKPAFATNPPTIAKLLQASPYPYSAKNVDESRPPNGTILYDRTFSTSLVDDDVELFALKLDHKNHPINYISGSTTNCMGGLYIGMVNEGGNALVAWSALTRYTDP